MKIFDPKLTGSIEILNTISGNVTIAGGLTVEGSLGGSATTASYVEYSDVVNKPTLVSSSAQIASDISGSFTGVSSSLEQRVSVNEGNISTLTSATSSYALESNISGAFDSVSSSLSSRIASNEGSLSSLNSASSSYLLNTSDTLVGDLTVTGTITAQEFHTEFVSASILYDSGSTKFGNSADDIHSFTGSIKLQGNTSTSLVNLRLNSNTPGDELGITFGGTTYDKARIVGYNENSGNAAGQLRFYTGGWPSTTSVTEAMRITSTGTVGVNGAPAADDRLYVNGDDKYALSVSTLGEAYALSSSGKGSIYDVAGTIVKVGAAPNSVNTGALINFNAYNSTSGATGAFLGAVAGATGNGPASLVFGRRTGTTSWVESMRIGTNGDVGIGTNAPTTNYPLTLRSRSGDYTKILDWGTDAGGSWGTMTINTSSAPYETIFNSGGFLFTGGPATFSSSVTANSIVVRNSGVPAAQFFRDLDVVAVGAAGQGIEFGARSGGSYIAGASIYGNLDNPATTGGLVFQTLNGGSLGTRLTIASNGSATFTSSTFSVAKFNSTYGQVNIDFQNNGTGFASIGSGVSVTATAAADDLGLGTGGLNKNIVFATGTGYTERMRITSGGNVGISNSSPTTYSGYKVLHIGDGTAGNTGLIKLGTGATSDGPEMYASGGRLSFNTNSSTNVLNLVGSNVGIGTTSPTLAKLQVEGNASTNGLSIKSGGNGGTYPLMVTWSGGTAGDAFCVDDNLFVGIGTTSPASKFTVYDGDVRLNKAHVEANTATWSQRIYFTDEVDRIGASISGFREQWVNAPMGISFSTGGLGTIAERMRITSDGNVGIGTTSPNSPLHVVGRVNTNRIVSGNIISGNIRSNLTTTSYLLLVDLNNSAGFSLAGKLVAASYTTWNVSDIYVRKDYAATTGVAVITGISKSGSNLSIVDISHSSGRFIAIKLTGDPEIDVLWTGYRLSELFNSDGTIQTLTSGVTENSTYASY